MLTEERQKYIIRQLQQLQTIKLMDIVNALNTSVSTIRRDFDELEKKGLLRRIHGGATLSHTPFEADHSISERSMQFLPEKKAIGQYASTLVQEKEFIYLDSGTTTSEIIPFLQGKDILVVTNGIYNLERLIEYNIPSLVLGGKVKPITKTIIGEMALQSLNHYRFSKAFIGANSIHHEAGITTPDISEALLKRQAILSSQTAYIVADNSKFDSISYAKICDFNEISIITNGSPKSIPSSIYKKATILFSNPQ